MDKKIVNGYAETHLQGNISIEKFLTPQTMKGDIGIEITEEGKIFLSINGELIIRFKPHSYNVTNKKIGTQKYCHTKNTILCNEDCLEYYNCSGARIIIP